MIKLDVNLEYLTDNYHIGSQQLKAYRGKSIREIMEIEARNGNEAASKFNINLFSNPMEVVKIFRLMSPENRYQIIDNMCRTDKMKLLSMLEKGEMLMGIRFFQKEKILKMLEGVENKKLLKVVLQKYNLKEFMKMIPEKLQNKFFDAEKISPEQIMKGVQYLEPEQMAKMIENVTGIPQKDQNKESMMKTLMGMKPETLKKSVKSLEQEEKAFVMAKMIQEDPNVIKEIDKQAFLIPLEQLNKGELIESMAALDEEDLLDMMTELPDDLMSITATQIDPEKFAKLLTTDFSAILGEICAEI